MKQPHLVFFVRDWEADENLAECSFAAHGLWMALLCKMQWIWRQYASAFWDDVRLDRVLPFRDCKEPDDERHVHPLQLDVIDRCIQLWSNPGETVATPFMGVGSEVFGAVTAGRRGIGIELKASYYRQALANLEAAARGDGALAKPETQRSLFGAMDAEDDGPDGEAANG